MKRLLKLFAIVPILIATMIDTSVATKAAENINVRVGYMHENGYHEITEDGTYYGYGYEYLQLLSQYSNLNYEFLAYEATDIAELLEMLENGEIDIITNISKTEERISKYQFSEKPMGNCSIVISVKGNNTSIIQGDYSTYDGMKVGLVDGMGFNALFLEYAEEKDFTYEIYEPYFLHVEDAEEALQAGLIDALVYSDFRVAKNEKSIDKIESHSVYTITRKEGTPNYNERDKAIMKAINEATDYLDVYNEGWRTYLKNKYFSISMNDLYLTTNEKEVIKKYSAVGTDTLDIIAAPNMSPYIWFEMIDGKARARGLYGMLFDRLLEEIGNEYGGINYNVIIPTSYEQYLEYININNLNKPDIIIGYEEKTVSTSQTGYISTDVFDSASIARVYLKNISSTIDSVVYLESMPYMKEIISKFHPDANVIVCKTAEEALQMIRVENADMFYTLEYAAMQYVDQDQRGLLRQLEIHNGSVDLCFGVNNEIDHELALILSKYVRAYSGTIIDEILASNTDYGQVGDLSFVGLLYNYPVLMITVILGIAIVIFMIVITSILRLHQLKTSRINDLLEMSLTITPSGFIQFIRRPDGQYELLKVNPAAIKMFGYDDENDFIANWYNGVVNSVYYEDRSSIKSIYNALSDEQNIIHEDLRVIHKDGTLHILDGECAFVGYQRRNKIYLHTFRDSTDEALLLEQREREMDMMQQLEDALNKAEVASSAKSIFLSNMSHDIRTPLNAIIGFLNILRRKILDNPSAMDTLRKVDAASNNLVEIINNVLDMSRIENGKEVINNVVFSPVVVRDELDAIYTAQAEEKSITLSFVSQVKYTHYYGDPLSLKKILMNLISNAIKYTPSGGNIIVEAKSLGFNDEGCDRLQFKIIDNGYGMSDEFLTKLFVPFEREFNTTQSGIRGTGLGMAIVKQLVELMNGTILVESKKEVGTTFILEIPFLPADKYAKKINNKEVEFSIQGFTILVAEDNSLNAEIIKDLLEAEGAVLTMASNGKEAYDVFVNSEQDQYDLILMDVQMPIMDGCETTIAIRESDHPNAKSIPIVAITANAFIEDIEKSMQSGMNAHISKPINIKLIKQKLASLVNK